MTHAPRPLTLALLAVATSGGLAAQHERPPVFQDLDFAAALEKSEAEGKLLILDAMTSWCGPCKIMDRTTWVDEELVAWIRKNAIAIQLDMDVHTDVKDELVITAYPTIVAFREGEEFDRFIGLRDAAFVGKWLTGAAIGKTGREQAADRLAAIAGNPEHTAERADLCLRLARYGAFDAVTPELLDLWRNGKDAEGGPYRRRDLLNAIGLAAEGDATARAKFTGVRDTLGEQVEAAGVDVDRDVVLSDWLELNALIGDTAATARWAVDMASRPGGAEVLQAFEVRLFRMLVDAGEWRAAGAALADPVRRARDTAQAMTGAGPDAGAAMPAIPMAPRGAPEDAATKREPGAEPPKVVPAIPLVPRPAAKPDDAASTAKVAPMIPMAPRGETPKPVAERSLDQPLWDNPADPEVRDIEIRARVRYAFRQECADRYAALLAADRIDEAAELANVLLATIDSPRSRSALVARALRAGQLEKRPDVHLRWLEEAGG